jgi:hypothetical protein
MRPPADFQAATDLHSKQLKGKYAQYQGSDRQLYNDTVHLQFAEEALAAQVQQNCLLQPSEDGLYC